MKCTTCIGLLLLYGFIQTERVIGKGGAAKKNKDDADANDENESVRYCVLQSLVLWAYNSGDSERGASLSLTPAFDSSITLYNAHVDYRFNRLHVVPFVSPELRKCHVSHVRPSKDAITLAREGLQSVNSGISGGESTKGHGKRKDVIKVTVSVTNDANSVATKYEVLVHLSAGSDTRLSAVELIGAFSLVRPDSELYASLVMDHSGMDEEDHRVLSSQEAQERMVGAVLGPDAKSFAINAFLLDMGQEVDIKLGRMIPIDPSLIDTLNDLYTLSVMNRVLNDAGVSKGMTQDSAQETESINQSKATSVAKSASSFFSSLKNKFSLSPKSIASKIWSFNPWRSRKDQDKASLEIASAAQSDEATRPSQQLVEVSDYSVFSIPGSNITPYEYLVSKGWAAGSRQLITGENKDASASLRLHSANHHEGLKFAVPTLPGHSRLVKVMVLSADRSKTKTYTLVVIRLSCSDLFGAQYVLDGTSNTRAMNKVNAFSATQKRSGGCVAACSPGYLSLSGRVSLDKKGGDRKGEDSLPLGSTCVSCPRNCFRCSELSSCDTCLRDTAYTLYLNPKDLSVFQQVVALSLLRLEEWINAVFFSVVSVNDSFTDLNMLTILRKSEPAGGCIAIPALAKFVRSSGVCASILVLVAIFAIWLAAKFFEGLAEIAKYGYEKASGRSASTAGYIPMVDYTAVKSSAPRAHVEADIE